MLKRKNFVAPAALLAVVALGGGCGDDDNKGDGGSTGSTNDGGGGGQVEDLTYSLIPITDTNDNERYQQTHTVYILDTKTQMPVPGLPESLMSSDGRITIPMVPADAQLTLWTAGSAEAGTYDSIGTSPRGAGEEFIYLSETGTATLVAGAAMFELKPDRAAVVIGVYYTPGGVGTPRMGNVACAQVFLDGNTSPLDENSDQRYVKDVLPEVGLDQTYPRGSTYFANMPKGSHSVKISVDGGKTLVDGADLSFEVFAVRSDAKGDDKNIIYTLGIDSPVGTPADCVQ